MKKSILIGMLMGVLAVLGISIYAWLAAPSVGTQTMGNVNSEAKSDHLNDNNQQKSLTPNSNAIGYGSATRKDTAPLSPQTVQPLGNQSSFGTASVGTLNSPQGSAQGQQAQASAAAAPWSNAGSAGLGAPSTLGANAQTVTAIAVGKLGGTTMAEIQQRLQALVANGRQPSAMEVDAVLADLQKNQGNNSVAGVDLQSLRDTLGRTDRIQQIAKEMQAIASNPSKTDLARIQTLTAEMQRIQANMLGSANTAPSR